MFRDDYVSPADRHAGIDGEILKQRHAVYLRARERSPRRWVRHTRNWPRIDVVTLNPERDDVVAPAAAIPAEMQRTAA
jgi:putative transposase